MIMATKFRPSCCGQVTVGGNLLKADGICSSPQHDHPAESVRMSAFGAKRTSRERRKRPDLTKMTDTVEKGFWGRSLSNIDSRSNATAQSRLKNPFVRIRLF